MLSWLLPEWVIDGRGEASASQADGGGTPPGPGSQSPILGSLCMFEGYRALQ